MVSKNTLASILQATGQQIAILPGLSGDSLLTLQHGGRIIGLFPPDENRNFFWTSPALQNIETAKDHFASPQWCNSGGERSWIAPEANFFFPAYPESNTYFQPRQMDPGNYQMEYDGAGVTLRNDMVIHSYRTDEDIALRLTKHVAPIANPLTALGYDDCAVIKFAGYSVRSSLSFTQSPSRMPVGLWQLLQLPHGGEMLQPTFSRVEPEVCFGNPTELLVSDRGIRWRMRTKGAHKIGIKSAALAGRIGYCRQDGKVSILIVMNFTLNPSADYADYPAQTVDAPGYMVECCSASNPQLGDFSELEYHLPAIGGNTGCRVSEDERQVWAFAGSSEQISSLIEQFLGII